MLCVKSVNDSLYLDWMRRGGKGHKGKGLTVPIVNIMPQVLRLERDSRRRTKREAILEVRNPEGPTVAPSRQNGRIRAPRRPFSPFRSPRPPPDTEGAR